YPLLFIPPVISHVHGGVDSFAHAAHTGAESMHKSLLFFQRGKCQICNAFIFFYIHMRISIPGPFYLHILLLNILFYLYLLLSVRSEEHTSELQSRFDLVCRLLLVKIKTTDRV